MYNTNLELVLSLQRILKIKEEDGFQFRRQQPQVDTCMLTS